MVIARAIMPAATSPSVPIPTICSNSQARRKISARKKNTRKNDLRLLPAICSYMDDLRLRLLRRYAPRKDENFGDTIPNSEIRFMSPNFHHALLNPLPSRDKVESGVA